MGHARLDQTISFLGFPIGQRLVAGFLVITLLAGVLRAAGFLAVLVLGFLITLDAGFLLITISAAGFGDGDDGVRGSRNPHRKQKCL